MEVPSTDDLELGRRAFSRLRLGIRAYLDTIDGRKKIRLLNLSPGGAQVIMINDEPVREGVLQWLQFETYAVVVWQRGTYVGLQFDRLLSLPCLVETRERAPSVVREEALQTESDAQAWVTGAKR